KPSDNSNALLSDGFFVLPPPLEKKKEPLEPPKEQMQSKYRNTDGEPVTLNYDDQDGTLLVYNLHQEENYGDQRDFAFINPDGTVNYNPHADIPSGAMEEIQSKAEEYRKSHEKQSDPLPIHEEEPQAPPQAEQNMVDFEQFKLRPQVIPMPLVTDFSQYKVAEQVEEVVEEPTEEPAEESEPLEVEITNTPQEVEVSDGFLQVSMLDLEQSPQKSEEEAPSPPLEQSQNYHYSPDHNLYRGGAKSKFRANVEAITTLKTLEREGRSASEQEQITLAGYVGWGGLANALTPNKVGWEKEYKEIKELLTEEEFQSASESTLTAYYTEQMIVQKMYQGLHNAGFTQGTILDPAMGTGNFYSVLPEEMTKSKLYGVELDSITGRIAQKLYPQANIEVRGFEHTSYPDNFFDVTIGNIPFNDFRINDAKYNKYKFKIHDYFIAKSIDQVRPNGIIAVITSKGTLDKQSAKMREYVAGRAELVGAIRLPNSAFKQVAGTEVTSDILFFQKREQIIVPTVENSPWLRVGRNDEGIPVNQYFLDHPEMLLGTMVYDESMYGNEQTTSCHPIEGEDLERKLQIAIDYLDFQYQEPTSEFIGKTEENQRVGSIEADHRVKNHSYTVVNDQIYYRENSKMYPQDFTGKKAERVKGLVQIHEDVKGIIDYQTDLFIRDSVTQAQFDDTMVEMRHKLNTHYDDFVKKYGFINYSANVNVFRQDGAAPLLRSIEKQHPENEKQWLKADIFHKPTIRFQEIVTEVRTAQDALMLSMNEKGQVDLEFMSSVYVDEEGELVDKEVIIEELKGQIYLDPAKMKDGYPYQGYVVAEEYLSGYVKDKLRTAKFYAEDSSGRFQENVEELLKVQPTPLKAHEIDVRLGSTWIPTVVYEDFIYETCDTASYNRTSNGIELEYSHYANKYHIEGKNREYGNVLVNTTYGTKRKNAYEIIEDSLNLQKTMVRDPVETVDHEGKKRKIYVLNREETILARSKQEEIERKFKDWIFSDPQLGEKMVNLYNDKMNNLVVRRYSGKNLTFPDQNPEIKLRTHQKDVVAHGLFSGGNLLMAHEVGAGKTYSAITLAHEMKRLGTAKKPLITVPNHLVGQWADAFMTLYPDSNIMVATAKDLKKEHRKRFISRIATSDYDAIIMPHSSFELISMSREYKMKQLEAEIEDITSALTAIGKSADWGTKQMQIFQKRLQTTYNELIEAKVKDEVVNFEQLGVDALFVDESHTYKNNFSYSKLRGVAGVGGTPSQRAMDMHMKAQYINQINDGKGVIYLTGTPVSNTLAELYVIQKTLQPHELQKRGLTAFDNWVSAFAEITAENEIKPEGSGWQIKNRLSHFYNTPELMKVFRMVADIRTAEMLDEIPVPKAITHHIETKATPIQKEFIKDFAKRGEDLRTKKDSSTHDNFLKITQDARNCAIDPRSLDPTLPNDPDSKLNVCAQTTARIFHETSAEKLAQLVFCDKGVPNDKLEFDFYRGLKGELMRCGVPSDQIAFIHDYKTDEAKENLFEKMRKGDLRILIGSTAKMGAGLNVQDKLIAVHHLDVPWKPSDLIQRNGRILRQGNQNPEVNIYNYVTGGTFDSYLWQILEKKQKFISQIMRGDDTIRRCDDIDETVIEYAALKAMAMDNPRLKEKMELDNEVMKLSLLKSSWEGSKEDLKQKISIYLPTKITNLERTVSQMQVDLANFDESVTEEFHMSIADTDYVERSDASEHLGIIRNRLSTIEGSSEPIGKYGGFPLSFIRIGLGGVQMAVQGRIQYSTDIGDSMSGAITRLENVMKKLPKTLEEKKLEIKNTHRQIEQAKAEAEKPFPDEKRLEELQQRKTKLDLELEFGTGDSMGKEIYDKLEPYLLPLLSGETDHITYHNEPYMPLVVEKIGSNEYSICHYYEQNGDLMRDPEITFIVEDKVVKPTSYLQDGMGIYYRCEDVSEEEVKDLKEHFNFWANNIIEQGFDPQNPEQEEEMVQ
ncbi:MAG: SNF2-related protein, partial [Eubacteriales bacterium]